ncbi:MAG: IMP dehydrogenase, partial [Ardenticatenaceae bacterium]
MKIRQRRGLTFDDVLLVPKHSGVRSRRDVSTQTKLTSEISLHIPVVSANMDTVTESEMAITMAHAGGIGIIHRFMTVQRMVEEVRRVKRAENLVIENPLTIEPDAPVAVARRVMDERDVGGLLILDDDRRLRGILTVRDVLFEDDPQRPVRELMTRDVITAPTGTTLEEARLICHRAKIEKLPLVDESGRVTGLITTKDIVKRIKHPNATKDSRGRLRVGAAIGVKPGERERASAVVAAGVDLLVLDIAHGHSTNAVEMMGYLRREYPKVPLIAGNVATADGTKALIEAGASAVKVGVGPGAICITRVVTGFGVPQITALMDTYEVAHAAGIPIIADGGIRSSGDMT